MLRGCAFGPPPLRRNLLSTLLPRAYVERPRLVLTLYTHPTQSNPSQKNRTKLVARNVPVGPGKEDYVRTLEAVRDGGCGANGGASDARVPVVLLPGYGAGACFFWR